MSANDFILLGETSQSRARKTTYQTQQLRKMKAISRNLKTLPLKSQCHLPSVGTAGFGGSRLGQGFIRRRHGGCPAARGMDGQRGGQSHQSTNLVTRTAASLTSTASPAGFDEKVSMMETDGLKPMEALDGPTGWPVVGNFLTYLKSSNQGQMHLVQAQLHKKYGKIFREKWGTNWQVHVSDPTLIEDICRKEGRYPNRPQLQSWLLYRNMVNKPLGIMSAQGSEWQLYRNEFGKRLQCPHAAKSLIQPFNSVVDDLVESLRRVRDDQGEMTLVKHLSSISYEWSLEMSGTFLFETRLGCLGRIIPVRTKAFIDALQEMLNSSLYLIVGESLHQKLNTPFWKRHKNAWDKLFEIGKLLIDERIKYLDEHRSSSSQPQQQQQHQTYLSYCLSNKNVSMDQIYTNITELLFAGTETTANSLCFLLHLLATNKSCQEKVYEEVQRVLGGRRDVTQKDLDDMKYLKCVIKESLRLYPIVTMNCRILEDDIVLDGYVIPKKTLFVMNQFASTHDNDLFQDADKFLPERWLRELPADDPADGNRRHPFGCLPFGFGSRSCVGQRISKMELMTAVTKILQNFELEPFEGADLKPILRVFLTPGEHVPVRFNDRSVK